MSVVTLPIDFNAKRVSLITTVERVTGLKCIVMEAERPDAPRPSKPYFGIKLTTPAARMGGDDDHRQVFSGSTPTTKSVTGGQRKMTASVNCFARTHEEAYAYMALLQTSLEHFTVREILRRDGIAVWIIGNVADLSALLNTGYEGRAQMDVQFGIASNLTEDLGEIDTVGVEGTIQTDNGTQETDFTVTT